MIRRRGKMNNISIGMLAKQVNVNIETIRYYERIGLLAEPPRNKSGHRQYSTEEVIRTEFIKRCQVLGFSLKEIQEILELRMMPRSTCADMQSRVADKLTAVDKKINELTQIRDALTRLQKKCTGRGPIGKCPIIEELYR
jgi:Hg(II)-responsive transcriptional regulator